MNCSWLVEVPTASLYPPEAFLEWLYARGSCEELPEIVNTEAPSALYGHRRRGPDAKEGK
jgi:hypothetical protein